MVSCEVTLPLVSLFPEWQRYSAALFRENQSEEFYEALLLEVE